MNLTNTAFYAAACLPHEQLQLLHTLINEALANGKTYEEFKDSLSYIHFQWVADEYCRNYARRNGYVVIYNGKAISFQSKLKPGSYIPGCYAIGINGDLHEGVGGNPADGIKAWILVKTGDQA